MGDHSRQEQTCQSTELKTVHFRTVCEGHSEWEALELGLCPKVKVEPAETHAHICTLETRMGTESSTGTDRERGQLTLLVGKTGE